MAPAFRRQGTEMPQPDLVIFDCESPTHLPYHLAVNQVSEVIKSGRPVVQ